MKFGLTVGLAFGILGGVGFWRGHLVLPVILGTLGAILLVAGLVIPGHLGPAHRAWMAMAHAISRVTNPIFMSIMYVLVITPTGLLMRLLGRQPLRHREGADGFWHGRENQPRSDLNQQF
jgi:hypothetical protein